MKLWLDTMRSVRLHGDRWRNRCCGDAKYVDINSVLVVLGGQNSVRTKRSASSWSPRLLAVLAWSWFRPVRDPRMLLAATIAATLILNVYVPVYDTIILIPALVMVRVAHDREEQKELQAWMLLFCLVPWLTQSAASDFIHIQILTIVIAGFATGRLDVEIPDVQSVLFDKFAAAFHVLAHQRSEDQVGLHQIFERDF